MNKNVIIGAVIGIILGFVAFQYFEGGTLILGMTILLGLTLGWLSKQRLRFNFYITAIFVGILFYLPVAFKTGLYADDTMTGGTIGLVIALFTRLFDE